MIPEFLNGGFARLKFVRAGEETVKKMLFVAIALVLAIPAWDCVVSWDLYYRSIAMHRFFIWMQDGAWRSPAAQYGNAQLGVGFEYGLGLLGILLAYVLLLVLVYTLLNRRRKPQRVRFY